MTELPEGETPELDADDPALTGEPGLTPEVITLTRRLIRLRGPVTDATRTGCLECPQRWPCPSRWWALRQLKRAGIPSSPRPNPDGGG